MPVWTRTRFDRTSDYITEETLKPTSADINGVTGTVSPKVSGTSPLKSSINPFWVLLEYVPQLAIRDYQFSAVLTGPD